MRAFAIPLRAFAIPLRAFAIPKGSNRTRPLCPHALSGLSRITPINFNLSTFSFECRCEERASPACRSFVVATPLVVGERGVGGSLPGQGPRGACADITLPPLHKYRISSTLLSRHESILPLKFPRTQKPQRYLGILVYRLINLWI